MNQPTKPDSIQSKIEEVRDLLSEAYGFKSTSPRAQENINAALIAHINTLIAAERIEGRRDAHETNVVLVNENDKLREKLALITPAAPSGEAVAQVDEGDDGLFIDIIYGPDGSDLKRGDKLYTHPAPRDVDAPIVLPELAPSSPEEVAAFEAWAIEKKYDMTTHPLHWLFLNEKTYAARQGWKAGLAFAHATAAVQNDRANWKETK